MSSPPVRTPFHQWLRVETLQQMLGDACPVMLEAMNKWAYRSLLVDHVLGNDEEVQICAIPQGGWLLYWTAGKQRMTEMDDLCYANFADAGTRHVFRRGQVIYWMPAFTA